MRQTTLRVFWGAAALLWTAVVFGATITRSNQLDWVVSTVSDKLLHGAAFAVGAVVWAQALRTVFRIRETFSIVAGGILSFAVGGMIEYLQRFVPVRTADPRDLLANAIGILAAMSFLFWRYRRNSVQTNNQ